MVYRLYRDNMETRPRRVSIWYNEISTSYNLSSCIQPPTLRLKLSLPSKLKTIISYAFKIWTYSTGVTNLHHFASSLTTEKSWHSAFFCHTWKPIMPDPPYSLFPAPLSRWHWICDRAALHESHWSQYSPKHPTSDIRSTVTTQKNWAYLGNTWVFPKIGVKPPKWMVYNL